MVIDVFFGIAALLFLCVSLLFCAIGCFIGFKEEAEFFAVSAPGFFALSLLCTVLFGAFGGMN